MTGTPAAVRGSFQYLGDVDGGFRAHDGKREGLLRDFPVVGGDGVAGVVLKCLRVGQDVVPTDDLFDFE